eukprot:CAMPEP_0197263176 /NCGR_PEP_ID=MMETSP1432-20130617/986_1 /TAXON_ID=44447 /ORGANISM="Pseudo-nitzschia delicatissima, Strain UNC1205" /LENGTH=195 /DNA_ID=CAMNT_0042727611 /DNA_START=140 /DNA_END=727 /DNA_ORIENTATION=+
MSDTNTTATVVPGDAATAPSAPISSPVAPPVSAPTTEDVSPVVPPVSAPTAKESFPDDAPVSAPVADEIMSPVSAPVTAPVAISPVYESPVYSPASLPSRLSAPPLPTTYGDDKTQPASMTKDIETFVLNPIHLILIAGITGLVTLLIFWKCCKSWKLRREKQMLRLQSTRVDAVLGDMQMVGMDDYDGDDPELI